MNSFYQGRIAFIMNSFYQGRGIVFTDCFHWLFSVCHTFVVISIPCPDDWQTLNRGMNNKLNLICYEFLRHHFMSISSTFEINRICINIQTLAKYSKIFNTVVYQINRSIFLYWSTSIDLLQFVTPCIKLKFTKTHSWFSKEYLNCQRF